jgi:hypothetical protein
LHTDVKLAIVAGDRTLGQILGEHVWGHAVILYLPIDVEAVDGVTWGHHVAAVELKAGEKIAQMIPVPVLTGRVEEVESLEDSARAEKGFGSSGR